MATLLSAFYLTLSTEGFKHTLFNVFSTFFSRKYIAHKIQTNHSGKWNSSVMVQLFISCLTGGGAEEGGDKEETADHHRPPGEDPQGGERENRA